METMEPTYRPALGFVKPVYLARVCLRALSRRMLGLLLAGLALPGPGRAQGLPSYAPINPVAALPSDGTAALRASAHLRACSSRRTAPNGGPNFTESEAACRSQLAASDSS